jgi:hypothetical protein
MASRLDDLIREHAERLDQLAGPIDLTDVTSAPSHDTTTVALVDNEPTWNQTEGRHRWPVIAVAAAAVAAVVVGGLVIATRTDDPTGKVPADQPITVAPTTTVAPFRVTGTFEGGGRSLTYTVPDGWINTGWMVIKRDPLIGVMFVGADDDFFTKMCPSGVADPPVGRTIDDLVSAWVNLPGVNATAARDVTIDGFDGKQIALTVPDYDEEDCAGMYYRCSFASEGEANRCENLLQTPTWTNEKEIVPNQHREIWILDVNGSRVMIMAWSLPDISQQDRAALDEIVASIQMRDRACWTC